MIKSIIKQPSRLSMMLAMDKNKLIGKGNAMPWHIPGELAYFKQTTMGLPLVMGRKTFESIGRPLPGRPNFVVTRNAEWQAEGVSVCLSLEVAIAEAGEYNASQVSSASSNNDKMRDIMIIGGAGLCREAMPITDRIYLTHIDHAYEGDVWFDSFDWNDWQEVSRQENELEGLKFSYLVLDRV